MHHPARLVALAAVITAAAAASTAAVAQTATYGYSNVNAAGPCQGALPAFAGTLRARPLGLQNEGTGTAFVTCALERIGGQEARHTEYVRLAMANQGTTAATIGCTIVYGTADDGADYGSKSVTVPAQGFARLLFTADDLPEGQVSFGTVSLSCALPPSTGIGEVAIGYDQQQPNAARGRQR